jgi:hypothetical protein
LIPPPKLLLLHDSVVAACDTRDGLKDRLIEDPRGCDFHPKALKCKGQDRPDCLTAPQAAVAEAFYSPTVNPRTREEIYPGLMRGSEAGWSSEMGMDHCGGGDGPNAFDAIGAIERWVEVGKAPDRIIASHMAGGQTERTPVASLTIGGRVDRTRPFCPYPQVAAYKGRGSTDDAANFKCKTP